MSSQREIKNTYYDALFFASATINEKQYFFLRAAEYRVLEKLIHYSKVEVNITWSSENISKHLCTSVDSIDKTIQRLRQKGYINVINQQRGGTNRKRTIYINWEFIESIDILYNEYINKEEPLTEEGVTEQTITINNNETEMIYNPKNNPFITELNISEGYIQPEVNKEEEFEEELEYVEETTKVKTKSVKEMMEEFFKNNLVE